MQSAINISTVTQ